MINFVLLTLICTAFWGGRLDLQPNIEAICDPMSEAQVRLEPSWKNRLAGEFGQPYMNDLREFLREQYGKKKKIYPAPKEYFAALDHTPFEKVKVVILG